MGNTNEFCTLDGNNAPQWSVFNAAAWKLTPNWPWAHLDGGQGQLFGYKTAWVTYNKSRILAAAPANRIPADLLGCVILNEVGGDPPWVKRNIVLPYRQYVPHLMNWLPGVKPPLQTSEGVIKIQLQAALSALGQERTDLTRDQQNQLTACLETDSFNIEVVARLLRQLILFDYPKIDTRSLTDEQFIIAGSRYNRGTARPLRDFIQSLRDPPGKPTREYTSYGRAMLRHRAEVRAILGM
jgi:hypothetical protein